MPATDPIDPAALAARLPHRADGTAPQVTDLHALTGGASNQIWSFRADGRSYVLRRPPAAALGLPLTVQAAAMRAAHAAGVPVPAVRAVADDDPQLGPHVIMDLVEGETIPRRIQRAEDLAAARAAFAGETGAILAWLRTADVSAVAGLDVQDPLEKYRETLDVLGAPSATFEWALRHLAANRPPPSAPALVHGDFRLGNLMVGPEGVRAVLDWELVHIGDPLEDLGWLCTKTWRFGGAPPVGGLGSHDALLAGYREAGGPDVPLDVLHWWELLGSLKWGVICMMQASRHFAGPPSVELAAIGRRVAEVEWDLLGMLP